MKGEMFVRQALMQERKPFVCFKRRNAYLKDLDYAHGAGALHVVDETEAYRRLVKVQSPGVANDTFCEATCDCPGQVNWHAGWKMQRFRGVHMALAYLDIFASAVSEYRAGLAGGKLEGPRATDGPGPFRVERYARQAASVSRGALAGAGRHSDCRALFCSQTFRCAMSWDPTVGASLVDVVRGGSGGAAAAKWALQHPNARVEAVTRKGQTNCHYRDSKRALVGTAASTWLDLDLPSVPAPGTIGFCGDFPEGAIHDLLRVKLNGLEIQDALEFWHGTRTLGVSAACDAPLRAPRRRRGPRPRERRRQQHPGL